VRLPLVYCVDISVDEQDIGMFGGIHVADEK
jgi:hypothetical protein